MTATQDAPKTDEKPKTDAETKTEAPKEKKPAPRRKYRIFRELKLDVTDPASLIEQLMALVEDPDNPQPVTVLAVVGAQDAALNPKDAVRAYGTDNDMKGDYEVVAASAINTFKNVSTAPKRAVTFG